MTKARALIDRGPETARVRDVMSRRLQERLDADGGIYVQALGIIEILRESTTPEQLARVVDWFLALCAVACIEIDDRPFSSVEMAQAMLEPSRSVVEQARESVRRALHDAKSTSEITIPVLIEFLAVCAGTSGAEMSSHIARWILRRLRDGQPN